MGNDVTKLNEITDGISGKIVRSVIPGINTVRGTILKEKVIKDIRGNKVQRSIVSARQQPIGGSQHRGGSFRGSFRGITDSEASPDLFLPEIGSSNSGQTWLAIQNSILARTTDLIAGNGEEVILNAENQIEIPEGKLVIWGYGRNYPSNFVFGDIFSTTILGSLLVYDEIRELYVLDLTAQGRNGQPSWVRTMLGALYWDEKYIQTRTYFVGTALRGNIDLVPVGIDILHEENGSLINLKSVHASQSDEWKHLVTAVMTVCSFIFANFHGCLHVLSGTTATALLMSVNHSSDVVKLIEPVCTNVFEKQEEVFTLFWGDQGVFVKSVSSASYDANPEVVYAACRECLESLVDVVSSEGSSADVVNNIMAMFVRPAGSLPEGHAECFCPGTRAQLAAVATYTKRVDQVFHNAKSRKKVERRLAESYDQLGSEDIFLPLATLGQSLMMSYIAGSIFHRFTALTKLFYTPLVSTTSTVEISQTITEEHLEMISTAFIISEHDKSFPLGKGFNNLNESNKYFAATRSFKAEATKIRKVLSDYFKKRPRPSGVQPTYSLEGAKMNRNSSLVERRGVFQSMSMMVRGR